MKIYTSGEVARLLGIRRATLIYMEETGKIPPARRTGMLKRYFTDSDIQKLREAMASAAREKQK